MSDVLDDKGKFIERDITIPSGEVIHVVAGENQHILKNGAIQDYTKGRIVKGAPKGGTTAITPENARDYHELRYQHGEDAILAAISKVGAGSLDPSDYKRGWQAIGENLASMALSDQKYAVDAAKFLGNAGGLVRDRRNAGNLPDSGVQINLGSDIASQIIAIMAEKRKNE
jgi:hypothetical protein